MYLGRVLMLIRSDPEEIRGEVETRRRYRQRGAYIAAADPPV